MRNRGEHRRHRDVGGRRSAHPTHPLRLRSPAQLRLSSSPAVGGWAFTPSRVVPRVVHWPCGKARGGELGRGGGLANRGEDAADGLRVGDEGDGLHRGATARAGGDVELVDPGEQTRKGHSASASRVCAGRGRRPTGVVGNSDGRGAQRRRGRREGVDLVDAAVQFGERFDLSAQSCARGEDAAVANLVDAGRGDQSGEALAELGAREDDVGGAVGPAAPELEREPAVGETLEAMVGDGRPAHVAEDALALLASLRGDGDAGVEIETEAGLGAVGFVVVTAVTAVATTDGIGQRAEAEGCLAGPQAGSEQAADGGGIAGGEEGLLLGESVEVEVDVTVDAGERETALAETFLEAEAGVPGDSDEVAADGRWEGVPAELSVVAQGKNAVRGERVEVKVEVGGTAKTLDPDDRPGEGLGGRKAERAVGGETPPAEEAVGEVADEAGEEAGVVGEEVPQRWGEREDPLPGGDVWDKVVDDEGRNVGSAASHAGGAEAAALAREGDESVEAAAALSRR